MELFLIEEGTCLERWDNFIFKIIVKCSHLAHWHFNDDKWLSLHPLLALIWPEIVITSDLSLHFLGSHCIDHFKRVKKKHLCSLLETLITWNFEGRKETPLFGIINLRSCSQRSTLHFLGKQACMTILSPLTTTTIALQCTYTCFVSQSVENSSKLIVIVFQIIWYLILEESPLFSIYTGIKAPY